MNTRNGKELDWKFYYKDGTYAFTIEAYNQINAYNKAYAQYGPQVDDMRYQQVFTETPPKN